MIETQAESYDHIHKSLLSYAFSYIHELHVNEKFDLLIIFFHLIAENIGLW